MEDPAAHVVQAVHLVRQLRIRDLFVFLPDLGHHLLAPFHQGIRRGVPRLGDLLLHGVLALILGIAVASYANWEQGRTLPALTYLPVLASYFHVTTDYLLGISKQDAVDRVRERMKKLPKSSQVIVESLIEEMLKK
jgi:DNA-binding XRE family transcriptional regulator